MKKLLLVGVNSVHTYNFYKLIKPAFDDVILITDKRNEKFPDLEQHEVYFGMRNILNAIRSIFKIRRVIRSFKPDIIHMHIANSVAYYTLRAKGSRKIPAIVTAWGSEVLVNPRNNIIVSLMLERIVARASAFTVDAKIVGEVLQEFTKSKKLIILNSNFGVEIPKVGKVKDRVIYSNRLHEPNYRIDKIIIAFAFFPDKRWRLRIAGTGSQTEVLKALADKLQISDRVDFLGWLDHDQNYEEYAKATVYA
ncbi:MAG: glycosyltransferase, partial [Bacteroidia bacterium]|nr:glycosyltransferase [Bacteroidia bacterium]